MRTLVAPALVASALAACGGKPKAAAEEPTPATPACPATATPQATTMEVLLHAALADASGLGPLAASFDISPQRLLLLEDAQHLHLLGWGGIVPVDGLAPVDAFAYTPDGLLMTVRGNQLSYLAASGTLESLIELPSAGMGIAAGADSMFLFERQSATRRFGLFELAPGKKARLLLESPEPIDAVAHAGPRVLLVSGGAVFEATPEQPMRVLAHLPGARRIQSVAADSASGRVYFSDGAAVFAVKDGCVGVVSSTLGGTLRVRDGALFVFDAKRRVLVRFPALQ
ncbi:MAG TPA: hypothetical protein VM261_03285 [Kofleriaceae bacterium]|nr:hypothetical protein [Kofleriaceae bacterium]